MDEPVITFQDQEGNLIEVLFLDLVLHFRKHNIEIRPLYVSDLDLKENFMILGNPNELENKLTALQKLSRFSELLFTVPIKK